LAGDHNGVDASRRFFMTHAAPDADATNFRCIIADDSAFARKNIATVLERLGGSVVGEAADGLEAIDLYEKLRPDLVLLDITMPRLDGVETLRKIMEHDRDAKVIIISSVGHKEIVWKAICLGAKSFVTKPYNPDYAGMVIRDVVAGPAEGVK
jgi:two-component system, chemotaxis family, chemotaxis protein CheY